MRSPSAARQGRRRSGAALPSAAPASRARSARRRLCDGADRDKAPDDGWIGAGNRGRRRSRWSRTRSAPRAVRLRRCEGGDRFRARGLGRGRSAPRGKKAIAGGVRVPNPVFHPVDRHRADQHPGGAGQAAIWFGRVDNGSAVEDHDEDLGDLLGPQRTLGRFSSAPREASRRTPRPLSKPRATTAQATAPPTSSPGSAPRCLETPRAPRSNSIRPITHRRGRARRRRCQGPISTTRPLPISASRPHWTLHPVRSA